MSENFPRNKKQRPLNVIISKDACFIDKLIIPPEQISPTLVEKAAYDPDLKMQILIQQDCSNARLIQFLTQCRQAGLQNFRLKAFTRNPGLLMIPLTISQKGSVSMHGKVLSEKELLEKLNSFKGKYKRQAGLNLTAEINTPFGKIHRLTALFSKSGFNFLYFYGQFNQIPRNKRLMYKTCKILPWRINIQSKYNPLPGKVKKIIIRKNIHYSTNQSKQNPTSN